LFVLLALAGLVNFCRIRLDQKQRVIELNVRISELEALEGITDLAVSYSEKIAALRASMNRVRKHVAVFQTWQIEVAKRVLPEGHRFGTGLSFLPIKVFEFRA
jgi:hypothetical protein